MALEIELSQGSGKARNGCAKTKTLRVVDRYAGGFQILKQFRFTMGDESSLRRAYQKAHAFKNQREKQP